MESSTFPFCLVPARVDISAHCIPVIPVISGIDDPVELGPITRLPEGARLQVCGDGFKDLTVKIWWEGQYYFVFLEDLPEVRARKPAKRQSIPAESQIA